MRNKLNRDIVNEFYKYIPQTKELAHFLMETLDLSKESVYRRLRSEVPFTFDEISIIAIRLEISLDELIGLKDPNQAIFHMPLYKADDPLDAYLEIFGSNIDSLSKVRNAGTSKITCVLNRLPYGVTLYFENISKFYYYKWLFHTQKGESSIKFSDFELPSQVKADYDRYIFESENIRNCQMDIIVDENVFLYMVREILYFYKRGLINDKDLLLFQDELLKVVELTEDVNKLGVNKTESSICFYLSSVDIVSNYSYIEYDTVKCVQFWSPASEIVISYNSELCRRTEGWIESLKRYTTLITQCDDIQQVGYLNKQRTLIQNIANFEID
ncbi:MAG: hypothetical protein LBV43_14935 [Prevotella sp.]|jgi:hypothetical protein|nr:hypothetical protein [Prevotella sp.]